MVCEFRNRITVLLKLNCIQLLSSLCLHAFPDPFGPQAHYGNI